MNTEAILANQNRTSPQWTRVYLRKQPPSAIDGYLARRGSENEPLCIYVLGNMPVHFRFRTIETGNAYMQEAVHVQPLVPIISAPASDSLMGISVATIPDTSTSILDVSEELCSISYQLSPPLFPTDIGGLHVILPSVEALPLIWGNDTSANRPSAQWGLTDYVDAEEILAPNPESEHELLLEIDVRFPPKRTRTLMGKVGKRERARFKTAFGDELADHGVAV